MIPLADGEIRSQVKDSRGNILKTTTPHVTVTKHCCLVIFPRSKAPVSPPSLRPPLAAVSGSWSSSLTLDSSGYPQPPHSSSDPRLIDSTSTFAGMKNAQPGGSDSNNSTPTRKKKEVLDIQGYKIEGLSIGGQETCVIFPTLNLAFDIGRCPQRAISQDFLFISHGHLDHIGGLPMYVATRGLYGMKPPTIFVPKALTEHVQRLFEVHRAMDQSELKHNLVGLGIGEEFQMRKDLKVRAFKTYHGVPSQGYIIYSVKQKLKQEYIGLPGNEIKSLKLSGVEITDTITSPEVAFTGDTMSDFIADHTNLDVLKARVLVMECTFVDNSVTIEHARDYGHTHLAEIIQYSDLFKNKAILLIHFSARYHVDVIKEAISKLPTPFTGRVFALTEGI